MRVIGPVVVAAVISVVGCTRDPVGECAALEPGDLVVTELRGPQDPGDTGGIWVELWNASGDSIDIEGVKLRFRKIDGSDEVPIIVRRSLTVAAGAYVVLGLVDDEIARPEYIDYGFAGDFHQSFLAAAALDVEVCGTQLDRARYENLPKTGTYSFGGMPTSDNNDVLTMWCVNPISEGTPGAPNPTCD